MATHIHVHDNRRKVKDVDTSPPVSGSTSMSSSTAGGMGGSPTSSMSLDSLFSNRDSRYADGGPGSGRKGHTTTHPRNPSGSAGSGQFSSGPNKIALEAAAEERKRINTKKYGGRGAAEARGGSNLNQGLKYGPGINPNTPLRLSRDATGPVTWDTLPGAIKPPKIPSMHGSRGETSPYSKSGGVHGVEQIPQKKINTTTEPYRGYDKKGK